jgi:hypothetical protein
MMMCGHTANAHNKTGDPCCVICIGIDAGASRVDTRTIILSGRIAKCDCGKTRPSNSDLAFFEYRGPGSRSAMNYCKHCGYTFTVHTQEWYDKEVARGRMFPSRCWTFEPRGDVGHDLFYCGCKGWD